MNENNWIRIMNNLLENSIKTNLHIFTVIMYRKLFLKTLLPVSTLMMVI